MLNEQVLEVTHAGIDVLCRIVGIGDPVARSGCRHQLHGAGGALRRNGLGVEPGFHAHHRRDEDRHHSVDARVMFNQRRQMLFALLRALACAFPRRLATTLRDSLAADEQPITRIQALTGIAWDALGGIRDEDVADRCGLRS